MSSISPAKPQETEDEYSVEYSFAIEYSGPALTYNIPKAVPVDVDQIPVASIASSESILADLSLPIIHPIVNSDRLSKKLSGEYKLGNKSSLPLESTSHMGKFCGAQIASSGSLGLSDSHDNSPELSGTSDIEDLEDGDEEGLILGDDASTGYEFEDDGCVDEGPRHLKKPSIVTFHDPESSNEPEVILGRPEIKPRLKKGCCYHCLKRNLLSEKEGCIVCNAKYCGDCVIRAMGSMPEGRKCIACISKPINESNRGLLGKPSRLLRQLFIDLEIKNIMQSEMLCKANQLPPTLVYVNGKPLCRDEFNLLLTCPYPPKKVKPGRYWYDKTAGYWGKEGQKPCQIISAELAIGGEISLDCSNGKAKVVINKREITKAERQMLQWAKIRCEGRPSFWLGADGSLQEEGMNNVIAKIWDKSGIRLLCSMLSLPIPPQSAEPLKNEVEVVPNDLIYEKPQKMLLVGSDDLATSIIFKQARMVHNVHFTDDEREEIKTTIQSSLYTHLGIVLEGREQFEEEFSLETSENSGVYSLSPKLGKFSDWLVQVMVSGNLEIIFTTASREYAPRIEELLKDRAFQAAYSRMNELHMVPRVAKYILDRGIEISRVDYEPSETDILYADGITSSNGLTSMEFSFPKPTQDSCLEPAEPKDPWQRKYQLVRIHSKSLGENCKWLEMFEETDLVIYSVSLNDYDQFSLDKNGVSMNKMLQSKKLFENMVTHRLFRHKNFLLLLTDFNLLEEKIEQAPLTLCEWFQDFNPVISHHPKSDISIHANTSLAHRAFQYIGMKFKMLFRSVTGLKLYVLMASGLEPKSVGEALKYAREILNWEEEKPKFSVHDSSIYSNEASTST